MGRDTSESDSDLSVCHTTSDFEDHLQRRKQILERFKHKCFYEGCKRTFYRPSKLKAHLCVHEGKSPFVCSFDGCDKRYTNSSHLKRHIKVTHEKHQNDQLFVCPEKGCEVVLKTRQCLKKHIKRRHTDFPYQCTECDAKFKRNHNLKEHSFVHTGVYPYVCEECKKGFEKSYHLKRHQRSHRTYTCRLQNCSTTFPSMSLYRKHMATEHKSDYSCAVCNKKFKTLSNCKLHYITHMESESLNCPHENCESVFSQERYLKQHLKTVHEESHEYKCSVEGCEKVFKWKRSLFHHVKLHSIKKAKKARKVQRERKDKGQPRKCMAAELADITLPDDMHKEIILGGKDAVAESDQEVILENMLVSDSDELDVVEDNCQKNKQISPSLKDKTLYLVENVSIDVISDCDSDLFNKNGFVPLESKTEECIVLKNNSDYPVGDVSIQTNSDCNMEVTIDSGVSKNVTK
ncbi:transcription factor IIIA-like isoform X2 [Macrosteles quadrilineatus]|nr:transcription factor IIIA-like isoform X2 [Macrosteles quadrilineatus]XP_054268006.1 transcription factor IIIA-like isoform X2 [Macrosteles quadrilineatus]XP_054268007.1 transcription factor IIIA-like isoform X2 [Macrosteles quadrilineatus]